MAKKDLQRNLVQEIESAAFHHAELKSERLRILGVLSFAVLFIIATVVRVFVIRTASTTTPWAWNFGLAAAIVIYEVWMLRRVDLGLKSGHSLPARFWVLSTILETSIPAFAI